MNTVAPFSVDTRKEVMLLFQALTNLYEIHAEHGIRPGTSRYVRASDPLVSVASLANEDLHAVAAAGAKFGPALGKLLRWAASQPSSETINQLSALAPEQLQDLGALASMTMYSSVLKEWQGNQENPDEEYWQQLLTGHQFLLQSIFAYPIAVVSDKAYVGGKAIDNSGGNVVDYLLKNSLTANAVILEIKTPATQLIARPYRGGLYNVSSELTGSVLQALNYRLSFSRELHNIRPQGDDLDATEPPCIVIIGHTRQLDCEAKRKSFELFRRQFSGVQIITYDELFCRAEKQFALLRGDNLGG